MEKQLYFMLLQDYHWQRGSLKLVVKKLVELEVKDHKIHYSCKEGLAIMPQGDEIFHGLTVEHLDSGAFTPESQK